MNIGMAGAKGGTGRDRELLTLERNSQSQVGTMRERIHGEENHVGKGNARLISASIA